MWPPLVARALGRPAVHLRSRDFAGLARRTKVSRPSPHARRARCAGAAPTRPTSSAGCAGRPRSCRAAAGQGAPAAARRSLCARAQSCSCNQFFIAMATAPRGFDAQTMAVGARLPRVGCPGLSGRRRGEPCCARRVARAIQLSACGASAVIVNPCDTRGILPGPQTQARPLCSGPRPAHAARPCALALLLRPLQRRPPERKLLWCALAPCGHLSYGMLHHSAACRAHWGRARPPARTAAAPAWWARTACWAASGSAAPLPPPRRGGPSFSASAPAVQMYSVRKGALAVYVQQV